MKQVEDSKVKLAAVIDGELGKVFEDDAFRIVFKEFVNELGYFLHVLELFSDQVHSGHVGFLAVFERYAEAAFYVQRKVAECLLDTLWVKHLGVKYVE